MDLQAHRCVTPTDGGGVGMHQVVGWTKLDLEKRSELQFKKNGELGILF